MTNHEHDPNRGSGWKLALPFFLVLGILTIVSFLIPLRPTRSQMEKRNLARFPDFSWSALADGSYFDDITLWFSDTFPGREGWISLSSQISSLHGHSEIAFSGDLGETETVPPATQLESSAPTAPAPEPTEAASSAEEDPLPTETEEEAGWGGVDAGDDVDVELNGKAIIQIGDSAFNAVGFSQHCSDAYAAALNGFAEVLEDDSVRIVSAPAPTAVGILIAPENLAKMKCVSQDETIRYLHGQMDDRIIKVDTYAALVAHNDEYIYFRTDHHWTARGAYYAYAAICEALGYEAVPLEECQEWDQGEMEGSLYWKAPNPRKLKKDTLIAYLPKGDFELRTRSLYGEGTVRPLIQDVTKWPPNSKYSAFLFSDNPLVEVTNNALPDGKTCLVIKDSFGNALVPFLAQNYHKVYAIDYRKFHETTIRYFHEVHPLDDVIFAPYVIATQSQDGPRMFSHLCK